MISITECRTLCAVASILQQPPPTSTAAATMPPQTPPSSCNLQRLGSLTISDEDKTKALDAIIVAIGIVSVLITNVAYVGYLTTPGGPDPYWLDCNYPMFNLYIYFNGFAMVFSTAAIAVVTFGPYLLIRRGRSSWRKRVVKVGLFHLAFSLITLLAAFACAGFVVALVAPPALNCANIVCGKGGISCVLDGQPPSLHSAGPSTLDSELILDPQVEYLNQDVLIGPTSNRSLNTHGSITCCNYAFVQVSKDSDPCFAMASTYGQGIPYVPGSKSIPQRYGYTTWCKYRLTSSSHRSEDFCQNIPLMFGDAYGLFRDVLHVNLTWDPTLQPGIEDSNEAPLFSDNFNRSHMDAFSFYEDHSRATALYRVQNGTNTTFCPLQPELAHSPVALNSSQLSETYIALVCTYNHTHGDRPGVCRDPRKSDGSFQRSPDERRWVSQKSKMRRGCLVGCEKGMNRSEIQTNEDTQLGGFNDSCNQAEMCDWHNHLGLRYQCSGGPNPTLCDYGPIDDPLKPPLAVDLNKKYMTKKTLAEYPDVYIAPGQTTDQVRTGVMVMLVVASVANVVSFVTLAGPTYLSAYAQQLWVDLKNLKAFQHRRQA